MAGDILFTITVIVLALNIVVLVMTERRLKNTNDWLDALDKMMEGRSSKTRCQRCGLTYNRDKSQDICPDCAELLRIPRENDVYDEYRRYILNGRR